MTLIVLPCRGWPFRLLNPAVLGNVHWPDGSRYSVVIYFSKPSAYTLWCSLMPITGEVVNTDARVDVLGGAASYPWLPAPALSFAEIQLSHPPTVQVSIVL